MRQDLSDNRQYPWYMVDNITIEDRNLLHKATKDMLYLLIDRVNSDDQNGNININTMLLKRVWRAALRCPGFTPAMKDDFVYIVGLDDRTAIQFGMAPYASHWKYLWTIGPKPKVPADVLLVSLHGPHSLSWDHVPRRPFSLFDRR
jgi:hypothetical protein